MANFQQASTFLRSLGRAALPDSMRSEKYTEDDFNEGMMRVLTDFVRANYAGKKPGTYGVDYPALNRYFKEGNVVTGKGSKFSDVGALKTVLGQFDVRVNEDGSFTILDDYNFNQQDEFGNPMTRQATMGDVFSRLNPLQDYRGGFTDRLYGAARMLGGVVLPEGGPNSIPIEISIPSQAMPVSTPTTTASVTGPLSRPSQPSFSDLSAMIAEAAEQSLQRKRVASAAPNMASPLL